MEKGVQSNIRSKVIKLLATWDGELIEPKYTPYVSSSSIKSIIENKIKSDIEGTTPNLRLKKIRSLINDGNRLNPTFLRNNTIINKPQIIKQETQKSIQLISFLIALASKET